MYMLWSSAETGFSTKGLLKITPLTSTWSSDSISSSSESTDQSRSLLLSSSLLRSYGSNKANPDPKLRNAVFQFPLSPVTRILSSCLEYHTACLNY